MREIIIYFLLHFNKITKFFIIFCTSIIKIFIVWVYIIFFTKF